MDNKFKTVPRSRTYVGLSLAIFVLVAAAASGLIVVNKGLAAEVANKQAQVSQIESEIAKLKEDKTVVLSDVILANQAEVAKAVSLSRAQDYIEALSLLEAKYGVTFDGFSFQAGRVSTSLVAETDTKLAAIRKLQALVKDARDNSGLILTLSNGMSVTLDLGRISYVAGDDSRRVASITFDAK